MSDRLVVIYKAADPIEANLLRERLAEEGIVAQSGGDADGGANVGFPPGWSTQPKLLVAEEQAEIARRIALDFDREVAERRGRRIESDDPLDEEPHDPAAVPTAWPRCPDCRRPRTSVCPVCRTGGHDFERAWGSGPGTAELNSAARQGVRPRRDPDSSSSLVLCPACDESFTPGYLRRCEWCGHEFDEGLDPPEVDVDRLNPAAIATGLAILAMLAVVAALLFFRR